ncbi:MULTISPECIES: hypothetical protein [unclassified Psychrobacillus]|uniref:hypothetical protein n=1 Tax=unclassified Psychrobacillus TaxID=2636677 RepID=UPI0030F6CD03
MNPQTLLKDLKKEWQYDRQLPLRHIKNMQSNALKVQPKLAPLPKVTNTVHANISSDNNEKVISMPIKQTSKENSVEREATATVRRIQGLLNSLGEEVMKFRDHIVEHKGKHSSYDSQLSDLMHIIENVDLIDEDALSVMGEFKEIRRQRREVKDFQALTLKCSNEIFMLAENARTVSSLIDRTLTEGYRAYQFRTEDISNLFEEINGASYKSLVPMFPPDIRSSAEIPKPLSATELTESTVLQECKIDRIGGNWLVTVNSEDVYRDPKMKPLVNHLVMNSYDNYNISGVNRDHVINHLTQRIQARNEEDDPIRESMMSLLKKLSVK